MSDLNCQKLTEILNSLNNKRIALDLLLQSGPTEGLLEQKEDIAEYLNRIKEEHGPDQAMIKALSDRETMQKIIRLTKEKKYQDIFGIIYDVLHGVIELRDKELQLLSDFFIDLKDIFRDTVAIGTMDSGSWHNFRNMVLYDRQIFRGIDSAISPEVGRDYLLAILGSVFIHKYLKEGDNITMMRGQLAPDYFGLLLDRGRVNVDYGRNCGFLLNGGTIEVRNTSTGDVGESMIKGKIIFHGNVGHHLILGSGMIGGTIEVRGSIDTLSGQKGGSIKANSVGVFDDRCHATLFLKSFEFQSKIENTLYLENLGGQALGVNISKAVVLIGNYDESIGINVWDLHRKRYLTHNSEKPKKKVYLYSEQNKMYYNLNGGEPIKIKSKLGLLRPNWRRNMVIVEDYKKLETNIFQGMKSGIIVLKDLPDVIGEGMQGGICIIEKEGTSIEEIRERISPKKESGFILMRVPDPDNPDKTKLVDVEE